MTATEKETKAKDAFDLIMAGDDVHLTTNGNFGSELDTLLRAEGFKSERTGSRCKVASFESNLEKNGTHVHIVVSNLFGVFTQVDAH